MASSPLEAVLESKFLRVRYEERNFAMAASSSTTKTLVFWFDNIWAPAEKACKNSLLGW
jgi:hypothetical protein